MRVAVLTHTFFPIVGGAEVGIHEIYRRFTDDDVVVVTPIPADYADAFSVDDPRGELPYEVHRYVRSVPKVKNPRLQKLLRLSGWQEYRLLRRLHKQRKLDAINIHFAQPFGMVAVWSKLFLRVPVTISLVGRTDVWTGLTPNFQRFTRLVLNAATSYTEITRYCLAGSDLASKAVLLPYGVDADEFAPQHRSADLRSTLGVSAATTVLIAAQRLSPVKRVDVLLDAAARLERESPGNFHLVVVGKGSESAKLAAKIAAENITNVTLAGYVSDADMPSYYATADVFVSHSMYETFGIMFAEAMASGLPIVAAGSSSVSEVVTDGENGFVVEPFDLDSFTHRLHQLRENDEAAAGISKRNRSKALTEYNWDAISSSLRQTLTGPTK